MWLIPRLEDFQSAHPDIDIRIDASDVPVDLDVVASGDLPPTLRIPIDASFDVRPVIKGAIQARMLSQTAFRLVAPVERTLEPR